MSSEDRPFRCRLRALAQQAFSVQLPRKIAAALAWATLRNEAPD